MHAVLKSSGLPIKILALSALLLGAANMDPSIRPGNDFYLYANGAWIKRTEIPADRGGWGVFSVLADQSDKRVAGLIEEIAKSNPAPGSPARKIADLYNSFMDEAGVEAEGLALPQHAQ